MDATDLLLAHAHETHHAGRDTDAPPPAAGSTVEAAYQQRTPRSARLALRAREVLPSGVTHDIRYLTPYGIYVDRAAGCHKWDVDGNEYVDYFGGHGSLLLGHNHPTVMAAVHAALDQGTQLGANHPREIRWAELVHQMVPSAARVRFTSSGTEATLIAVRLARASTGKPKLVRFLTQFHGWHDQMTSGHTSHFDGTPTAGVSASTARDVILLPPGDAAALRETLRSHDDIAAVIIEPTGTHFGAVPLAPAFLSLLREETAARGIVLIFDEVVTGFRVSPGGAQAAFGVTPDLTTLAKVLAGGLPGGAVCGCREIMDELDFEAAARTQREKVAHPGTYNANPVSAAAGIATLELVGSTDACARASATAERLRARLNEVLDAERVPWAVYGTFSGFHFFFNTGGRAVDPVRFDATSIGFQEILALPTSLARLFRLALLTNGVDVSSRVSGFVSAAHDDADVEATAAAVQASIRMLRADGELPSS